MDSSPEHVSGNAESDSAADSGSDSGQQQHSTADQAKQEEKEPDHTKVDSAAKDKLNAQTSSSGKIFVGGVSWETTTDKLKNHFKKYGEIVDSVIMKDRSSGHPRGFGFVTYSDSLCIDRVMGDKHVIDGRTVEVKRSVPRDEMGKGPKTKKIFVGGLLPSIAEEEFKKYFARFGSVVEHQIMLDHATGRSRGFGFVTFDNEQAVEDVLAKGKMHSLGGKEVEIKKAEPKKAMDEAAGFGPLPGRGHRDPALYGYGDAYGPDNGSLYGGEFDSYGGGGVGSHGGGGGGYGGRGGPRGGAYGRKGYGGGYGSYDVGFGGGFPFYGGSAGGYGGYGDGYGSMGYGGGYGASGGGAIQGGGGPYSGGGNWRYHPYGRF